MRKIFAICTLALLSAASWAQSPAPAPAPAPSTQEPKQAPLNLRLDNAARYARDPAPASGGAQNLPGLGEGTSAPAYELRRRDPIPKDTAPDKAM